MKTIRNDVIGKNTLRLVDTGKGFVGLVISGGKQLSRIDGDDPVQLWTDLRAAAGRTSDAYFGFDGARSRFRQFFPDGFRSPAFEEAERNYKLKAKAKLDDTAPLERALTGSDLGEAVLSVYRGTNLLSPFEKTRLEPLLRGPDADVFVQAAARFTIGEIDAALATMAGLLGKHDVAKWTAVTYLPFLWRPEDHMFLKPMVTQEFAERVGHPFVHDYSPALDPAVYASLRDLMAQTAREVADLDPRDNIDLQSLVWIVAEYKEGDVPIPAQAG
ncbi:hypothetical protein [Sphingopyxis yananensis]|uniref:hypothetical protein n=1 Tax=Sphingopyxis yananensis TaxID=2886687 RepID=UPI001D11122A|nr:hypothetical protein [Sphingopyxis yananensis]MCC2601608.1 hypothetical protein [Sphingopyxis yananensis]